MALQNRHMVLPHRPRELLEAAMPILRTPQRESWDLKPSSISTANQEPPEIMVPMLDAALFHILNDRTLRKVLNQDVDAVMVEDSHLIEKEGDVQRAINLYLLHTVNQILYRYLVECGLITNNLQFLCLTPSKGDSSYVDVLWTVKGVNVLALELKNWRAIDTDEWDALTLNLQPGLSLRAAKDAIEKKLRTSEVESSDNVVVILKQVAKYAEKYGTPYVLACDWGTMVCLDMKPQDISWSNDTNHYPRVLYTKGTTSGRDGMTFHRMVIAAFVDAAKRLDQKIRSAVM